MSSAPEKSVGPVAPRAESAPGLRELPVALPFASLEHPGDALLLRPDDRVRMCRNGAWAALDPSPLSAASYANVRHRLFEACAPEAMETGHARLTLADGRELSLTTVPEQGGESLWIRPAALPPPDPARLRGDKDRLEDVLRLPRGFVAVGGPDAETARRLLHALLGAARVRRDVPAAIVGADATYTSPLGMSPCLRLTPAAWPAARRGARPALIALDPDLGAHDLALEDLEAAALILGAAVGANAAAIVPRILLRLTGGDLSRARAALATTPVAVVMALKPLDDDEAIGYSAKVLTDGQRIAALSGDVAALCTLIATT
jgi:hypothetical protein